MSFGPKFAVSEAHCRAAFKTVNAALPAGLIPDAIFKPWVDHLRSGAAGPSPARDLLPPPERWPVLQPLCATLFDDPRDYYLHALTRKAHQLRRLDGLAATRGALPFMKTVPVVDQLSTPLHGVEAGLVRITGAGLEERRREVAWGCRCIETAVRAEIAKARGGDLTG